MTGKTIYRMSSAGNCPKRLSATRLGIGAEPLPQFVYTAAEEGNWHEGRIKNELRQEGYSVLDEQKEITIKHKTFDLIGHIDGILVDDKGADRLLEIKTMSQFEFDRWMRGGFVAFLQYAGQLACYSYATGLRDICYIVKNRSSGYKDTRFFTITENGLFNTAEILTKITEVEKLALESKIYPAEFDVESIECKRCEYKQMCLPVAKELNRVDSQILQLAVDNWRKGDKLQKEGKSLVNSAKDVLQVYAETQPEKKLVHDQLVTSMYSVAEAPMSYIRKAYTACKIIDLKKEEE